MAVTGADRFFGKADVNSTKDGYPWDGMYGHYTVQRESMEANICQQLTQIKGVMSQLRAMGASTSDVESVFRKHATALGLLPDLTPGGIRVMED